jgi:hypothetical protein
VQTYLDLVNAFIVELGINGGNTLASVSSGTNSLESIRICGFIADADYEIQSLHHNWKFLWRQFAGTLQPGYDTLASPTYGNISGNPPLSANMSVYQFRKIDRKSLVFNYSDASIANRPVFQDWRKFEYMNQNRGPKSVSNSPPYFSQSPGGQIIVSTLMASATPYRYECWGRPMRLKDDGDVSPLTLVVALNDSGANMVPPRLQNQPYPSNDGIVPTKGVLPTPTAPQRLESCRIIIARAQVLYATAEGATEIMQAALAEYQDLLEELRADQLPGMEHDRVSENDIEMTVETV